MDPIVEGLLKDVAALKQKFENIIKPEVGRWIDWTPVITQSGNVTFTKTYAKYTVDANVVQIACALAVTGAGTTANAIVISGIPVTAQPNSVGFTDIGGGVVIDASVTRYNVRVIAVGVNDFRFQSTGVAGVVGIAPAFALASGDIITFTANYERN